MANAYLVIISMIMLFAIVGIEGYNINAARTSGQSPSDYGTAIANMVIVLFVLFFLFISFFF